jgi:hypothetical protein
MSDELNNNKGSEPEWVLITDAFAKTRNFRNCLALKRWCKRREVNVKRDGKYLWIRPADIDAVVSMAPLAFSCPRRDRELTVFDDVDSAVNQYIRRSA